MAKKTYTFDEATHTHRIGDVIVPGITTLLNPLHNFDAVPKHVLQAACDFGTASHKTVDLFCNDMLDPESLDDPLKNVLSGFKQWLKDYGFKKHDFIVELPMGDPALMVACIPDLILDGKLIVEIKTREVNHLCDSIQTVCQEHVWKKNGGERIKEYERRVLTLRSDGTYGYTKVNDKQAMSRFRLLLDHYWNNQTIQSWRKA